MSDSGPDGLSVPVPYAPPVGPAPKDPVGIVSSDVRARYERGVVAWRERYERRLAFIAEAGAWSTAFHDLVWTFSRLSGDRKAA